MGGVCHIETNNTDLPLREGPSNIIKRASKRDCAVNRYVSYQVARHNWDFPAKANMSLFGDVVHVGILTRSRVTVYVQSHPIGADDREQT